jgi:hypothetical protein
VAVILASSACADLTATRERARPERPAYVGASPGVREGGADPGEVDAGPVVRFAVIGDYGLDSDDEARVAKLVAGFHPDFVITTGDNNYYTGAKETIDVNIGKHYASFIGNYKGAYGPGSHTNRFWPSLGNHDWGTPDAAPYLEYFTLPGNERYYDVDLGFVHLFAIDSIEVEPDGTSDTSVQAMWLKKQLAGSTACLDVVYFHYPPYSSGATHGSSFEMRWPFEAWGADVVMAGHDHIYERLEVGSIPYFIVGVGGASRYGFSTTLPESRKQFSDDFGAMRVTVDRTGARYEFFDASGHVVDSFAQRKSCP